MNQQFEQLIKCLKTQKLTQSGVIDRRSGKWTTIDLKAWVSIKGGSTKHFLLILDENSSSFEDEGIRTPSTLFYLAMYQSNGKCCTENLLSDFCFGCFL